jgi:phospholipid/cholesterol/gamma-HCH transport system substrate-binding protein
VTAIRKRAKEFAAIVVLAAIAGVVAFYILSNERFRFPWEEAPKTLYAELSTAQAVTPGQGQTIRVSGVKVGDIGAVKLKDGKAVVRMDIDPSYKNLIRTDAHALLRPKTGLKDMFIEVSPGSHSAPVAKEGFTIPVQNTLPDVNPDEIYGALDADTRQYLQLLVNGAGEGLNHRGGDLQEVFRRFEPTHRDLALVTEQVAKRRQNLRRLISSLRVLNHELANKGQDLSQLIDSSSAVFRAFASEDASISRSIELFPPALRQTTDTLGKVTTFANVLRPAATNLRPVAVALNKANHAVAPFAKEATPLVRDDIRPFVRESRPLVRNLRPAASNLAASTPDLVGTFQVLNHLFNMVGYDPSNGNDAPFDGSQQRSYLFWIAWVDHMANNLFATADANGPYRPIVLGGTCQSLAATADAIGAPSGLTDVVRMGLNLPALQAAGGPCAGENKEGASK